MSQNEELTLEQKIQAEAQIAREYWERYKKLAGYSADLKQHEAAHMAYEWDQRHPELKRNYGFEAFEKWCDRELCLLEDYISALTGERLHEVLPSIRRTSTRTFDLEECDSPSELLAVWALYKQCYRMEYCTSKDDTIDVLDSMLDLAVEEGVVSLGWLEVQFFELLETLDTCMESEELIQTVYHTLTVFNRFFRERFEDGPWSRFEEIAAYIEAVTENQKQRFSDYLSENVGDYVEFALHESVRYRDQSNAVITTLLDEIRPHMKHKKGWHVEEGGIREQLADLHQEFLEEVLTRIPSL